MNVSEYQLFSLIIIFKDILAGKMQFIEVENKIERPKYQTEGNNDLFEHS